MRTDAEEGYTLKSEHQGLSSGRLLRFKARTCMRNQFGNAVASAVALARVAGLGRWVQGGGWHSWFSLICQFDCF